MFSKKKEDTAPKYDKVNTLIGKSTFFNGDLKAEGTVRIEGTFEGELNIKGDLVVGDTGKITGNVTTANAHIAGRVEGNVKIMGQLHLTPSSYIDGDIEVSNLVVDEGAIFTGKCLMGDGKNVSMNETKNENKQAKKPVTKQ